MSLKVLQTLISFTLVYAFALEDVIYANGQEMQEMAEKGKAQYQLLQERGHLPQYGTCWKLAVEHVHEGCRHLSEETQSDMALYLANCFLQMSGHETYNCELDKKPNLRGICINSMSDRAFNVYTEFYTHAQNMCWFLRGQVWHETISENTVKLGKQLKTSAFNQDKILSNQRETLVLQEKIMNYSGDLGRVVEKFYMSTRQHQELLLVMSRNIGSLQSWLIGEVSWLDSVLFYLLAIFVTFMLTSVRRTNAARVPMLILLVLNMCLERFICYYCSSNSDLNLGVGEMYSNYYVYVWWCRNICTFLCCVVLVFNLYLYKDYLVENHTLLEKIYEQNKKIYGFLLDKPNGFSKSKLVSDFSIVKGTPRKSIVNHQSEEECSFGNGSSFISSSINELSLNYGRDFKLDTPTVHSTTMINGKITENGYSTENNYGKTENNYGTAENSYMTAKNRYMKTVNGYDKSIDVDTPKSNGSATKYSNLSAKKLLPLLDLHNSGRYNLRSRHGTPESNV